MRRFEIVRDEDVSGCSGVGIVAQGVAFDDGTAVAKWFPGNVGETTTVNYNSVRAVERIHGHDGRTRVEWIDKLEPLKN